MEAEVQSILNSEYVSVTDESGSFKICHFVQGFEDVAPNVRGTVVLNEKQIVLKHLPFVVETTPDKCDYKDCKNWGIQFAIEGTVIGLFYDNFSEKWRMCTHRVLDGTNYWSGEKFSELFASAWDSENEKLLDTKLAYSFILSHPDNKVIYNVDTPVLHIASVWSTETEKFLSFNDACEMAKKLNRVQIPDIFDLSATVLSMQNDNIYMDVRDLFTEVLHNMIEYNQYGFLIYPNGFLDTDPKPFKIISSDYLEKRQARGNVGSLSDRYLELRVGNNVSSMTILRQCYPESILMFNNIDKLYTKLCRKILNLYFETFVKKNKQALPKEEFVIIHKCHSEYLKNKLVKMSNDRVVWALQDTPILFVKRMFERV